MVGGFNTVGGFGTVSGFSMVITDIIRVVITDANNTWNILKEYKLVITVIRFCFYIFKNRLLGFIILIYPGVFKLIRVFVIV